MGLLSMHITGEVENKEAAQKISEMLRTHFPSEDFSIAASYREDLNTDKVVEPE